MQLLQACQAQRNKRERDIRYYDTLWYFRSFMVTVVGMGVTRVNLPFADNGVKIVVVMYY